ncbi:MAG: right-handed parallel beta-helix repeat-containing protein [Planctomycetota bacterium]|jgi:hypothetical protein
MCKKLKYLLSLVLLLVLSTAAQATDYYVSPSGNDANSGTSPGQAWQTISKINSTTFSPSDNIFFEGGQTFGGSLSFSSTDSGTAANPVTVGSYGTGRATISSGNQEAIKVVSCEGFEIQDLNCVGSGRTVNNSNGIWVYSNASGTREHIRINNVDVSGYKWTAILIGQWNNNKGLRDVRITNATVHDNGDKGICVYGQYRNWTHQDIYIGDCKVYDNPGVPGSSGSHTGNGIIISQVDGAVIEYCEAYNNGWLDDTGGGGPIGIWGWDVNDMVIQFCESYDNKSAVGTGDGGGFDLDGGCVNSVMQYNYSHGNHGAGYGIYQFTDAPEFNNNVVRYNISEGDGTKGYGAMNFWAAGSTAYGGVQNTRIYGNTLYVSSDTDRAGIDYFSGDVTNTEVYNNIIVTASGKRAVDIWDTSGGWTFKGNCYWTYDDNIEISWAGVTYTSLAAWRAATGQETHDGNDVGFELNPQLTDPGNGGTIGDPCFLDTLDAYLLQGSSPLINAGLDIQSLFGIDPGTRDYYGTDLPSGFQFDVGAHEYYFSLADFNYDKKVNFPDYADLAASWRTSLGEPDFDDTYDLYDDDAIDMADFEIFSAEWLWGM